MMWLICALGCAAGIVSAISYLWLTTVVSRSFNRVGGERDTSLSNLADRVWKLTDPQSDVGLMDGYRSIFGDLIRIGLARALVAIVSTAPIVALLFYSQHVAMEGPFLISVTISSVATLLGRWLVGSWLVGRLNKIVRGLNGR